jgi:hypothetical protein
MVGHCGTLLPVITAPHYQAVICLFFPSFLEPIQTHQSSHMRLFFLVVVVALLVVASAQRQYISTRPKKIEAAREIAKSLSPASSMKGKIFDQFVNIFLENVDSKKAAADRMFPFQFLPSRMLSTQHLLNGLQSKE